MNKIKKGVYIKSVILLVVVFILLYAGCFLVPKKIEGLSLEIVGKKEMIRQLDTQNSQIENIKAKYKELQKNVGIVSEHIIDYSNISNFVIEVKSVAEKNNVDLSVNVSNEGKMQTEEFLSHINYNIKAEGEFDDVMHFLSYLENLKYYVNVEKIKISKKYETADKKVASDSEVVLDSILKVYVREE